MIPRVEHLLSRLASEPQYPSQGATLFVDLGTGELRRTYTPLHVVRTFLEGRGASMFYLYNLLDPAAPGGPLDPSTPLIFGSGILTGIVPSAARGNVTSWSPETHLLMDSNAGDYFPSFLKLSGYDRIVVTGRAAEWTYLYIEDTKVELRDARHWAGLDNLDLRARVAAELGGTWTRDLAMASITSAGERGVLCAGIMAGPKAIYARGGTGAQMGAHRLKAIVVRGFDAARGAGANAAAVKPTNREIARQVLGTAVVQHALQIRGTPFLYKPSRLLGALGGLNNQQTTWTEALDAENIDPYRPDLTGCFRCPVNCRPQNDLKMPDGRRGDRYDAGDGPEYVTVGKFGPMIGISGVEQVIRLNNIANDLGLDTASLGSSIAWAMELYQRGIIGKQETGGLDLAWGNYDTIERLFFLTARREGFGDTIACSGRAIEAGKYLERARDYRMAVKGLMQSDPHDARIVKAFALGLAVATRGMDHLRNRVTLEINAKINDDPTFKHQLYGGEVSPQPNAYGGKARAVRACEDTFAVGDAVGMCRFTTKLFNSPSLPGLPEFARQIENVTGLRFTSEELRAVGLNITGLERMINYTLGARRKDDTLPRRWFDEPLTSGSYAGERIDRAEFERMLSEFYELSCLDNEGRPSPEFHARLAEVAGGFAVLVHVPPRLHIAGNAVVITQPVANLRELQQALERQVPGIRTLLDTGSFNFAVNDTVVLHRADDHAVRSGDRIDVVMAMAGG